MAWCLAEQRAGSDPGGVEARAEDKGDHWELTGTKTWVTNAPEAGVLLVYGRDVDAEGLRVKVRRLLREGVFGLRPLRQRLDVDDTSVSRHAPLPTEGSRLQSRATSTRLKRESAKCDQRRGKKNCESGVP